MVKIGFDIDGVALQYTERMAEVFRLFGGKTDLLHVQEFNFFNSTREEEMKSLGKRVDTLERDANTFLTAKSIILWAVTIAITMFGILYKR